MKNHNFKELINSNHQNIIDSNSQLENKKKN